jgi:hypothetical protein
VQAAVICAALPCQVVAALCPLCICVPCPCPRRMRRRYSSRVTYPCLSNHPEPSSGRALSVSVATDAAHHAGPARRDHRPKLLLIANPRPHRTGRGPVREERRPPRCSMMRLAVLPRWLRRWADPYRRFCAGRRSSRSHPRLASDRFAAAAALPGEMSERVLR